MSAPGSSGRPDLPEPIRRGRIIAIGRGLDPDAIVAVGEALVRGHVGAFEVTLNSDGALRAISALAARFAPEELLIGAGTVLDREGAQKSVAAGARFLVTPHVDSAIIDWAVAQGVPSIPGAFSPTEILLAWRHGAAAVKLFPASVVGPAFVREFRGPFRDIPLVPTGGVTLESAPAFIAAGAVAVALGGWLMGNGDPRGIERRAAQVVAAVAGTDRPFSPETADGG